MSKRNNGATAPSGEVNETTATVRSGADPTGQAWSNAMNATRISDPDPDSAEGIRATQEANPPKTRKRAATECRIERQAMMPHPARNDARTDVMPVEVPVGDGIYDTANFEVCEDMADGKKKVAAAGKSVKFRIVRVLCECEVKLETEVKARIV